MAASAHLVALSVLSASRGRALSAPVLVGAGAILGVTGNAMRVALSRLTSSGELVLQARGLYALSEARLKAVAHVRTYRTGFAARVTWNGAFLGVLTADLPRRNAALVSRREQALELSGFRAFRHGVWARPDNLEGGQVAVAAHLSRLGLDEDADVVGLTLEASQVKQFEKAWKVAADAARAQTLVERVEKFMESMDDKPLPKVAAQSFWLGDEVLRFLARDPLLPTSMADPAPRKLLTHAMEQLDERAYAVWVGLLEKLERNPLSPPGERIRVRGQHA